MDRKAFNSCIAEGMRGKTFTPVERRLEFCTLSKVCSEKAPDRETARRICLETPPKPPKTKRTPKVCTPKSITSLTHCLIQNTDFSSTSLEKDLHESLIKCMCGKKDSRKKKTAEEKVQVAMAAMDPSQRATFEQMIAENWNKQQAV